MMGRINIMFRNVVVLTLLLPLTAFFFCVYWSVTFNFKSATSTHCGVKNYLPSLSAAIGDYTPQRYVWRMAIGLHTPARFYFAFVYFQHYCVILVKGARNLIHFNCLLNLIEIMALFGLTFVSSTQNYKIHKTCFITFLITSTSYMVLSLHLLATHRFTKVGVFDLWTIRLKKILLMVSVVAIAASMYFFSRHNSYCEPLMYTWFALCEYLIVLCNMAFHLMAYWDFHQREWHFRPVRFSHQELAV